MPEVRHDPYAALRLKEFRYYASAWMFAVIGSQIQGAAIGWDLFGKTSDVMTLGWVGLLQAIPVMSLAIPAGHLADRFDRRRILMLTQSGAALMSAGLVVCSLTHAPVWAYYVLLFMFSVCNAFGWPARSSILPALVPMGALTNAITWNSSLFQLASVVGPGIGGLLLLKSTTYAYAASVLASSWYVISLTMVRVKPQQTSKEPLSVRSLLAGIAFVRRQRIVLATISLDLFAVLLGGATYLMPAVAKSTLGVNAFWFSMLRAAPAVGAITMGLLLTHLPPMRKAGRAMLWAVAGFGVATIIFGLSRNLWLSLAALFLTGAVDNISVVVRHTLVQVLTPDEMRGRVSAVNNVFIGASNELGGFESGLTAKLFGVTASIVGGGIGTLIVVAGIDRLFPEVRRLGGLHELKAGETETPEVAAETANAPK